jgi:hypothetical protein
MSLQRSHTSSARSSINSRLSHTRSRRSGRTPIRFTHEAEFEQIGEFMERRATIRYVVEVPVRFQWKREGKMQEGEGLTRNISRDGLFVVGNLSPQVGDITSLEVSLRSVESPAPGVRLKAKGEVVRVEGNGFAVEGRVAFARPGEATGLIGSGSKASKRVAKRPLQ